MPIEELYAQPILQVAREARDRVPVQRPTARAMVLSNRFCGDEVRLEVRVEAGLIREIACSVRACVLCEVSAVIMRQAMIGAVPPLMLKTAANPGGLPMEAFDRIRAGVLADRSQFFKDLSAPFYGPACLEAGQERATEDLQGRLARPVLDPKGPGQRGSARVLQGVSNHAQKVMRTENENWEKTLCHRKPESLSFVGIPKRFRVVGTLMCSKKFFASDFVDHTPQPGGFTPDRDGARNLYRTLRAAFPDFHAEIHWQISESQRAIIYRQRCGQLGGTSTTENAFT